MKRVCLISRKTIKRDGCIDFYIILQGMVKYCNRAWKKWFFASFFRNISKTAETILIKKIGRNHIYIGISLYKKALISELRKNYIFRDNCFVKMSVSCSVILLVSLLVSTCVTKFSLKTFLYYYNYRLLYV